MHKVGIDTTDSNLDRIVERATAGFAERLAAKVKKALDIPQPMDLTTGEPAVLALAKRSTAAESGLRAQAADLKKAAAGTGHARLAELADDKIAQAATVECIKATPGRSMGLPELAGGPAVPPGRPDRREELHRELSAATAAGDAWRVDQLTRDLQTEEVRAALHAPKFWNEPTGVPTEAGVPITDGALRPARVGVQIAGSQPA
jgi:hypothetical protein